MSQDLPFALDAAEVSIAARSVRFMAHVASMACGISIAITRMWISRAWVAMLIFVCTIYVSSWSMSGTVPE